jgi:hypothetical protein
MGFHSLEGLNKIENQGLSFSCQAPPVEKVSNPHIQKRKTARLWPIIITKIGKLNKERKTSPPDGGLSFSGMEPC